MIRDVIKRFLARDTDKVLEGRNRTRMVLGTDRKDTTTSGWGDGGRNDVNSGTIDIVVGFQEENPDYLSDASRVYIAGKTNPDEYFSINAGEKADGQASIVTISDNVYLIGRNAIKLVVGSASIRIDSSGNIQIDTPGIVSVNGSIDSAALASFVDRLVTSFNSHTHVAPTGGGATSPPPVPVVGTSASQKLKIGS